MKILADENIDSSIIAWLRAAGEDVLSIREMMRSAEDDVILARANAEDRVVLTKDMDFGELVFYEGLVTTGIILLRFKSAAADLRLEIVKHHWPEISRFAPGSFVVVSQDRLRVRRLSASKF